MPSDPAIRLQGVKKFYDMDFYLDIPMLEINHGEFVTIVGSSGAGKTTLLKLIGGFTRPDAGIVRVNNNDPYAQSGGKRIIRTLFQDLALFPHLSVEKQLLIALDGIGSLSKIRRKQLVQEWIERLELNERRDNLPHQLSGGQKQRLALGRAMISSPEVVLLDEPMTALDFRLRSDLWRSVELVVENRQVTFVVVTHDPDIALSRSDRIVVLEEGKCVQIGTPVQLYCDPSSEIVARLLGTANAIDLHSRRALIRPENVRVSRLPIGSVDFAGEAVLLRKAFKGDSLELHLLWEDQPLCARTDVGAEDFNVRDQVFFGWSSSSLTWLQ